jgi:hypothetical protein
MAFLSSAGNRLQEAVMSEAVPTSPCPFCGEPIRRTAVKCRYCGASLLDDDDEGGFEDGTSDPSLKWLVPIDRSGWAIAAGYLGLLSCFPLVGLVFGILAVVAGILALRHCKMNPRLGGRGRAIFGIVAGSIAGLGNLLVVVILLYGWATGWK